MSSAATVMALTLNVVVFLHGFHEDWLANAVGVGMVICGGVVMLPAGVLAADKGLLEWKSPESWGQH